MSERQRLYRADLGTSADEKRGCTTFSWYGEVTTCGEWVELGSMRWRRDDTWFESEAAAIASLADRIEAVGEACMRQAMNIRLRALDKVAT